MRTAPLARVILVTKGAPIGGRALLAREHPAVAIGLEDGTNARAPAVDGIAWAEALDFAAFDDAVRASSSNAIAVRGESDVARVACEVLTRYQRFVGRRNAASRAPVFDEVLGAHASLHDLGKPLVAADWDHALDTWQWLLRIAPHASLALQIAALFHDVERLESEPDRRIEHRAPDYRAFKEAHAKKGAEQTREILSRACVDSATCARACALVASHESRGADAEVDALNDADALSFFSLNSAGYADYFGPEQTRRKIAYTLERMSAAARARLGLVRLRRDVAARLREVTP